MSFRSRGLLGLSGLAGGAGLGQGFAMRLSERLSPLRGLWLPGLTCLILSGWALPSGLVLKKVLALLVLPSGLLWLGLMALVAWPGIRRVPRALAALALVLHTLAGNVWLGTWLLRQLEAPYAAVQLEVPLDAVCLLGGGTSSTPDGRPQLAPAGDRLIVPVRLFHSGKTTHLVASGLNVTSGSGTRSLADDTATLWLTLGIPDAAITRLSEPRTTKEEIRAFKRLAAEKGWQRIGICSSAWHLPRVERICADEKLEMTPVPADFLSTPVAVNPMYAIPQARGVQDVQKALWEFLGRLAGG